MKFLVTRTSLWDDKRPCERAYKDKYIIVDSRTVDDPKKLNIKSDRENWYKEGTNHRVENGKIRRDFEEEGWFIDINSLEELIEFKNEVGAIIIQRHWQNEELFEIEIYDYYRE